MKVIFFSDILHEVNVHGINITQCKEGLNKRSWIILLYLVQTGPKNLFEIANVRIIGWILKGNRKGIKNPFELAKVRIIGRRINGC